MVKSPPIVEPNMAMTDETPGADHQDVRHHLLSTCHRFERLFRERRIEEMVAGFYTEDAVLEGVELPVQRGRDAIAQIFEDARCHYDAILINLGPLTISGDVAYGSITNDNILPNGERERHRGMMIWRKVGDDWLVHADFFFPQNDEA